MNAPKVIAHRGSSETHPDNSWAAFEAAVAEGADVIECDVQSTRDHIFVVRHDLAIGSRLIADLTAAEIEDAEPGLVRLTDLLSWVRRKHIDLLVEIKEPHAAVPIAEMLATNPWRARVVVGGFHGPALAEVKARAPELTTSLMMGSVVAADDLVRLATAYRTDGVHLCWETRAPKPHRLLDPAAIGRLRDARLAITLWHEERESELRALVALEPDGICTNTPAALRSIVDEHARIPQELSRE